MIQQGEAKCPWFQIARLTLVVGLLVLAQLGTQQAVAVPSVSTGSKAARPRASQKKRSGLLKDFKLAQNDEKFEEEFDDLDDELSKEDDGALDSSAAAGDNTSEESDELSLDGDLAADQPTGLDQSPTSFVGEVVQITDLKYDASRAGGSILVQTSGSPTYRVRENPGRNQVVVEIANATLPDQLKRPFNTKDFKQSIIGFNAYQESGSNTARVVIQFREPRSVNVVGRGDTLQIAVTQGADSSISVASRVEPSIDSEKRGQIAASVQRDLRSLTNPTDLEPEGRSYELFETNAAPSPVSRSSKKSSMALPSSTIDEQRMGGAEFVGKPISIEVRETPVREVIGIIAEQSGANIILSDGIDANMTIKLRQVPWDQALSIIMKSQGLGYVRQGHVLRIAPLSRLQQEANEAQAILMAQESMMPLKVRVIPVSFADVTALARQVQNTIQAVSMQGMGGQFGGGGFGGQPAMLRGRIEADTRSSSLVVTDTEDNIQKIESLIRALDIPPLQVMIEGKIVEAREELGQAFGIDWGYSGQDLGFAGGTLSQSATFSPGVVPANTNINLRLGTLDFLGDLSARLTLLERDSKAKIISSPRIVTINNQEAEIAQTVSIPIPQALAGPAGVQTTFGFQEIPTTLKVKPQITPGGDVLMNIFFERQFQVGAGGGGAAGGGAAGGGGGAAGGAGGQTPIDKRRVQTNVMVKNGQTTVIGGIYQSDQNEDENKTPILGNVPILGWLFKSRQTNQIRNELLVFLTPRILNSDHNLPASEKKE